MEFTNGNDWGKRAKWLLIAVVLVGLVMGARNLWMSKSGGKVDSKKYQALFLTNGQVYFGKLGNPNAEYVKIEDIYYLQVPQGLQADNKDQQNQQQQTSLAKLGSELHGPEDAMYVSRDQVLFWENLKDDGKVAQAIKQHKSGAGN